MYSNIILKDTKYIREMITLSKLLLNILPMTCNSNLVNTHDIIINDQDSTQSDKDETDISNQPPSQPNRISSHD